MGAGNFSGNKNIANEFDVSAESLQNATQNYEDANAPNPRNESRFTNDSNIGKGGAYSNKGYAHGGWPEFSKSSTQMYAVGADSLIGMDFPNAEGGNSYTIVALKNTPDSVANINGFADPERFIDRPGEDPWYSPNLSPGGLNVRQPLTSEIIKWAEDKQSTGEGGGKNKRPYKYTDFVFCKYWNKIPNNHMMTLRRFPYPTFDNLQFPGENGGGTEKPDVTPQKYYAPIAQAITYMGEEPGNKLSSMLSFSAGLPYEENRAEVHVQSGQAPGSSGTFAKVLGILSGDANFDTISKNGASIDPYVDGPYMNRVQGPMNRIDSTMQRKAGLKFEQKFSLDFHYIARPIGGVNTKVAMLDIIANLLTLTYAEASFWGGSYRFVGGSPQFPWLGGPSGANALFQGDISGFYGALTEQISRAGSTISDIFSSLLSGDPIEGLKSLASSGAQIALGFAMANKRPAFWQLPALLTGMPVGEWHLTIGNPFNPIAEIGNLVCTNLTIKFGEELGPDDFPLEMTATIDLEHGMPRDKAAIESMFNRGGGKIYHIPDEYQFGVSKDSLNGSGVDAASIKDIQNLESGAKQSVHKRTSVLKQGSDIDRIITNGKRDTMKVSNNLLETAKMVTGYATSK